MKKFDQGGYQFLPNDFFAMCQSFCLSHAGLLLLIYLRGIASRFQRPKFYWGDAVTREHLALAQNTLVRARSELMKNGLVEFESGSGRLPTRYMFIKDALLPVFRVSKNDTQGRPSRGEGRKNCNPSTVKIKEILTKEAGKVFRGMSEKERQYLKQKGILP